MKKVVVLAIFGAMLLLFAPVTEAGFSPVITELAPDHGKVGDVVEIRGRYFIDDEHPAGRKVAFFRGE